MSLADKCHPQYKKCQAIRELANTGVLGNNEVYQIIKVLLMGDGTVQAPTVPVHHANSGSAFNSVKKNLISNQLKVSSGTSEGSHCEETCSSPSTV